MNTDEPSLRNSEPSENYRKARELYDSLDSKQQIAFLGEAIRERCQEIIMLPRNAVERGRIQFHDIESDLD